MKYDVVVVGSGAGGSAVAYSLCKAGYKVAVVEKGSLIRREEFSKDELAYVRRDIVTSNPFDEFHTIEERLNDEWVSRPTYETGWSFWNGNIVGGSSNFMSGMFHRMHPDDFRLKSKYGKIKGANIEDWAITYDELEPYYTLVEDIIGITGVEKRHEFSPPRSRSYFAQPPTKENDVVKLFDKSCHALGLLSLVTARAILSSDREHRKGCYYSNFCGSYGCSSGAKGSAMEALLKPALSTGNLTLMSQTYVKKLHCNRKDTVASVSVVNTITKQEQHLFAKVFVIAAQAHESARLLLNSSNSDYPNGLANSSGELGKNLIFSGGGYGYGELHKNRLKQVSFKDVMQKGFFVNRSILDWYFIDHWWEGKFKGGLVEFMFEHQNIISRAVRNSRQGEKLIWGKALGEHLVTQFKESKKIRFEIFNDWLPNDNCFVALDETHVDTYGMPVGKLRIEAHPQDVKVGRFIAKKCENVLNEMGAINISSTINTLPPSNLIAGGCRFGNNPKTSVLNKYCQTHDISNLFVTDASFMPTGGSTPYSWTIYANALRVGEYIVEQLDKNK
ncbi:MAG: GMC family oxidoreductase [Campylobacterota bacterium]|nr:GMC family oxidoreductase [Campylobacterota bacterium]